MLSLETAPKTYKEKENSKSTSKHLDKKLNARASHSSGVSHGTRMNAESVGWSRQGIAIEIPRGPVE